MLNKQIKSRIARQKQKNKEKNLKSTSEQVCKKNKKQVNE